jgi:hypothetical protein
MKRLTLFFLLSVISLLGFSQAGTKERAQTDSIFRLGGKVLLVNVISVSAADVVYKKPGDTQAVTLERKQIERIVYKSGRVDIFNKPVLQMIGADQWEAVLVTENKADIEGLFKYGMVTSTSTSDSRSAKAAKKSATIRLQKKAANLGANIIFLTKSQAKGGYGELPGYEMEGIAYGFEPPSEDIQIKLEELKKEKNK